MLTYNLTTNTSDIKQMAVKIHISVSHEQQT